MMNKKEKAAYDEAIKAVYVARALNWTEPVAPDLPVPLNGETRGFVPQTYHGNGDVLHALSTSVYHAMSRDEPPAKVRSQRPIAMYSTRLLALRSLRAMLEREYAENLARIDMEIEKEKGGTP